MNQIKNINIKNSNFKVLDIILTIKMNVYILLLSSSSTWSMKKGVSTHKELYTYALTRTQLKLLFYDVKKKREKQCKIEENHNKRGNQMKKSYANI